MSISVRRIVLLALVAVALLVSMLMGARATAHDATSAVSAGAALR